MRLLQTSALALLLGASSVPALASAVHAQDFEVTAQLAPPPLPVYAQPPIPAPDYIWAPGYWAWEAGDGYFWVPGTWVLAPRPGLLWTPGYWGYANGAYGFHQGYWGDHVGFYGGVSYGYGYTGDGYEGGRWQEGHFFYNRTVNNIANVAITTVYAQTIVNRANGNAVSFNGGPGGTAAQPTSQQRSFAGEQHVQPTAAQTQHVQTASHDTSLRASQNNGRPPVAATQKPNEFKGPGVVAATAAGPRTAPNAPSGAPGAKPGEAGERGGALPGQPNGKPLPNTAAEPARGEHPGAPGSAHPNATSTPPARAGQDHAPAAARPTPQREAEPAHEREAPRREQSAPRPEQPAAAKPAARPEQRPEPHPEGQRPVGAEPRAQAPRPAQPHAEPAQRAAPHAQEPEHGKPEERGRP